MPEPADLPTASAAKLPATLDFLGRAPLTLGDSTSAYDALLARLFASVRPSDPLEEIWTREVGDDVWESVRNRKLKAALMTACAHQGIAEILDTLQVSNYYQLAKRWSAREPKATAQVDAILAKAGSAWSTCWRRRSAGASTTSSASTGSSRPPRRAEI